MHINYSLIYQNCTSAVKSFLEMIPEHPKEIFDSMALALDSVRLYKLEQD